MVIVRAMHVTKIKWKKKVPLIWFIRVIYVGNPVQTFSPVACTPIQVDSHVTSGSVCEVDLDMRMSFLTAALADNKDIILSHTVSVRKYCRRERRHYWAGFQQNNRFALTCTKLLSLKYLFFFYLRLASSANRPFVVIIVGGYLLRVNFERKVILC